MSAEKVELTERLELIESMIAEGRRSTTRWGWSIVLWGVAFYVAIAWSSGDVWWSHLGPALHGMAGDDDGHVAAELGFGGADAQRQQCAVDHSGAGDHVASGRRWGFRCLRCCCRWG